MALCCAKNANLQATTAVWEVCGGLQVANNPPSQGPGEGREGINPPPKVQDRGRFMHNPWPLHALGPTKDRGGLNPRSPEPPPSPLRPTWEPHVSRDQKVRIYMGLHVNIARFCSRASPHGIPMWISCHVAIHMAFPCGRAFSCGR